MTTPGTKPLPNVIRMLHGNQSKTPINKEEPPTRAINKVPPAPKELTNPRARKFWKRYAKLLMSMRVLSDADLTALGVLCVATQRYWDANDQVEKFGTIVNVQRRDASGQLIPGAVFPLQNPHLSIANEQARQIHRMLAEFGMTPSARSQIIALSRKGKGGADPLGILG